MKKFISIISFFMMSGFYSASAQSFVTTSGNNIMKLQKYESYNDDILMFPSYRKADVYQSETIVIEDVEVNFNRLLSLFITRTDGKEIILNEYKYPKVVVYGNDDEGKRTFINNLDSKHPETYFEVLFESSDFSFLKEHKAKVIESGNFNYGKGSNSNYVKKEEKYYISSAGNFKRVKLKEKDITNVFKRNKSKLKKIAKKGDLSFKNEKDVVKIFSLYTIQ